MFYNCLFKHLLLESSMMGRVITAIPSELKHLSFKMYEVTMVVLKYLPQESLSADTSQYFIFPISSLL